MTHVSDLIRIAGIACLAGALAAGVPAGRAEASDIPVAQLKTFKDWVVGCNNVRHCTAIGLSPVPSEAYVVVTREGGAEAPADLSLVARRDDPSERLEAPVLTLRIGDAPVSGLSKSDWPAEIDASDADGKSALLRLRGDDAAVLLKAMRTGDALDVRLGDATGRVSQVRISLSGATAAFLYMDESQHRNGTVTALAATGPAPARRVPAPPALPRLEPLVMRTVTHPPALLPAGVTPPPAQDCDGAPPPTVLQLGPDLQLWGVCEFANHHNFSARYWLVGPEGAREAALTVPGHPDEGGSPSVLINLSLSQDGRLLESFTRGRGISDCGTRTGWVWTGAAFRLAYFFEMNDCRGVPPDDWPSLYVTRWDR